MTCTAVITPVCSQCQHYYNPRGWDLGYCPMGFSRNEWGELEDGKQVEPYRDSSGCRWYIERTPF